MNYNELVQKLRDTRLHYIDMTLMPIAADAIVQLQADLTAALVMLSELYDSNFVVWQMSPEGRAYLARMRAIGAGHEAGHPPSADWWAGKKDSNDSGFA